MHAAGVDTIQMLLETAASREESHVRWLPLLRSGNQQFSITQDKKPVASWVLDNNNNNTLGMRWSRGY